MYINMSPLAYKSIDIRNYFMLYLGQAAIRTCRISPNSNLLVIAGDDDMAHIFDLDDPKYKFLRSCKGHEATIFLACFSHDSSHLITGDNDGIILVWNFLDFNERFGIGNKSCFRVDDAHDLGVTSGDCLSAKGKRLSINDVTSEGV